MTYYDNFVVSGKIWHEVKDLFLFNFGKFYNLLNKNLNIEKYGTSIKGLAYIFIAMQPEDKIHKERTSYSNKKKELYIQQKLDYHKVIASSEQEVLRMMAATYLDTFAEFQHPRVKDFDSQRFHKDVQKLFLDLGWVESPDFYPVSRPIHADMVAAYLQAKNWKVESSSESYRVMSPPLEREDLTNHLIYIPLAPNGSMQKYEHAQSDMIRQIAKIYDKDRLELELLFSKNKEQLKAELGMLKEMVKYIPSASEK